MMKTKEPVFTGPKKGYSAFFIGDRSGVGKIRQLDSQGKWKWSYDVLDDWGGTPCWMWFHENASIEKQVNRMIEYDKKYRNETIFLGYVKDVE